MILNSPALLQHYHQPSAHTGPSGTETEADHIELRRPPSSHSLGPHLAGDGVLQLTVCLLVQQVQHAAYVTQPCCCRPLQQQQQPPQQPQQHRLAASTSQQQAGCRHRLRQRGRHSGHTELERPETAELGVNDDVGLEHHPGGRVCGRLVKERSRPSQCDNWHALCFHHMRYMFDDAPMSEKDI